MQFFDNLSAKFGALPSEQKKLFLLIGVVGIGLLLTLTVLIGGFFSSASSKGEPQEGEPEITNSPEEIAVMTQSPVKQSEIQFITKEDLVGPKLTPTPTPLPGEFYIPNGQLNDLYVGVIQVNQGDTLDEVQLINLKTNEKRLLGFTYNNVPGDNNFFNNDYSQVIFIGGPRNDYNKISVYSIPQNKILKYITLDQIKQALPALRTDTTSLLSRLMPSPDKSKAAVSYGNTFNIRRITKDTSIIVINLLTGRMQLLPVKGLVKDWKDDTTLEYEVNTTDPAINNTLEVTVSGI